jgi:CHAT domain-containing protein/tetratricopeptide (TPR) repeat protein
MPLRLKSAGLALATLILSLTAPLSLPLLNLLPVVAQTSDSRKAEEDRVLQSCRQDLQNAQYEMAVQSCNHALRTFRQQKNRGGEVKALNNLGVAYQSLGSYPKAIEYQEQQLAIARVIKDRQGEGRALGNLGNAYHALGNYPKAIEYQEQSLAIARVIKDRQGEGRALGNLGNAYDALGNYPKAIEYQEQQLAIVRVIKDRQGEGRALGNLGNAYHALGNYPKAIEYQEQSLAIARVIKNRQGEGAALGNLGLAYDALGNYPKAIGYQEQCLAIVRAIKDQEREGIVLSNIGTTLEKQEQPELAIVFYKQSVNVREGIRGNLRSLSLNLQESYTQTVAGTYRRLADLLIEQGRIGEAQQVLERLKIQELNDFTKGTRAPTTIAHVGFNTAETQIKARHTSLIAFGGKFYDCEQQHCPQFSELKTQYQGLSKEFQAFVEQIKQQLRDSRLTQVDKSTQDFQNSADRVVTAHPSSILIYPLVLEDKTRILWAAKGGALSKTAICSLGAKALYNKVVQFQTLLNQQGDETQLKAVGKELYDCLIKPLESELSANSIKHLIFVPDRATNYIPMGALFDGQQYLIQRYAVSNILAAGLTDTDDRLQSPPQTPVLALGLTQSRGKFGPLPNVAAELNAIVKQGNGTGLYPGDEYLDQAFTKAVLEDNLRGRRIVHIATHAEFKPANPRESYFLLGTGSPYPIQDVQTLRDLKTVHLVVLSACQSGLGGADGLGLEVSGMSSFFMGDRDRAKAVIASLWLVNDASTSQLMRHFYQNLATGTMTKAEALRQAQLAMLGKDTKGTQQARGDSFKLPTTDGSKPTIAHNLSHPYYWAPFILIGNGL